MTVACAVDCGAGRVVIRDEVDGLETGPAAGEAAKMERASQPMAIQICRLWFPIRRVLLFIINQFEHQCIDITVGF